ncbi:trigger factor [Acutalibacter muris]|uniref:Trigger factor n=2 Tax=Acutalibacter muris TaxID=1796620 RepID=A0ABM6L5P2_9FIRM|nr:trigger factor [Hungateiclostridiaceae bacterium KB18]ASB40785.1 trigger factor [Acutalibacter muris]
MRGKRKMNLKSSNNVETNKHELLLEVTPEELNQAINEVYRRESKRMNVPGFRKGKAPRAFIEKYYGEDVFFQAAVDHLYNPMMNAAIEQSELEVVGVNSYSIEKISKEEGIEAKLTVTVQPEVKIDGYKGIEVVKESVEPTAEEIDSEIERVRQRNSRVVTVEDRAAEDGDIVVIDFDGYTDGKQFDGGKAENFDLTLGSGQFIPGFEEQVVGHNVDDEFDVKVKFPEDYHAEELKGKDATFKIKLHEIKHRELPDVDDEFVKDVSEFDTLEEYRKDLENSIRTRKEHAAETSTEQQLIKAIVDKVEADVPQMMIDREVDEIINSFDMQLRDQGMNLETYLKYTQGTVEALQEQYRERAEQQVKVRLGLAKIAEQESLEVTDEEIEAEYKKIADAYGMPIENVKAMVRSKDISKDVANQKAMDLVKESTVYTDKAPEDKVAQE